MDDAAELAWQRMLRGGNEEEQVVQVQDVVGGMCVGTDVRGPQLADELIRVTRGAMVRLADDAEPIEGTIMGALARIFWMGYAHGEAAER